MSEEFKTTFTADAKVTAEFKQMIEDLMKAKAMDGKTIKVMLEATRTGGSSGSSSKGTGSTQTTANQMSSSGDGTVNDNTSTNAGRSRRQKNKISDDDGDMSGSTVGTAQGTVSGSGGGSASGGGSKASRKARQQNQGSIDVTEAEQIRYDLGVKYKKDAYFRMRMRERQGGGAGDSGFDTAVTDYENDMSRINPNDWGKMGMGKRFLRAYN